MDKTDWTHSTPGKREADRIRRVDRIDKVDTIRRVREIPRVPRIRTLRKIDGIPKIYRTRGHAQYVFMDTYDR